MKLYIFRINFAFTEDERCYSCLYGKSVIITCSHVMKQINKMLCICNASSL